MPQNPLSELEHRLGYEFADRRLLDEALNHSSYVNEQLHASLASNERLEFLGDAVVNLVVGHMLMEKYPDLNEGELSRIRAHLVNEVHLAVLAAAIGLGEFIRLGRGERITHGREKPSILADAYEALVAAVYLDGGFSAAFELMQRHFAGATASVQNLPADSDYKSRLQEMVQMEHLAPPVYSVVAENGPDHDKTFRIRVNAGQWTAEGVGKSKKSAEQEAARRALERIEDSHEH